MKALVVFPIIYLGVFVVAGPMRILSGAVIIYAIPVLLNVATLGGVAAAVAVLVAAGVRRVFVRGPELVDHWMWSQAAVTVVTLGYALVVFWNMVLRRL